MLLTDSAHEAHHIVVVLTMHGLIQQRRLAGDIAGEDRQRWTVEYSYRT